MICLVVFMSGLIFMGGLNRVKCERGVSKQKTTRRSMIFGLCRPPRFCGQQAKGCQPNPVVPRGIYFLAVRTSTFGFEAFFAISRSALDGRS
jgi:hypothetical protein